jgi:hypothetical protein
MTDKCIYHEQFTSVGLSCEYGHRTTALNKQYPCVGYAECRLYEIEEKVILGFAQGRVK